MSKVSVNKRQTIIIAVSLILLCAFAVFFFSGSSYAANKAKTEKNKALKVGLSFTGTSVDEYKKNVADPNKLLELTKDNSYTVGSVFKNEIAPTKAMKVNGKFYIPVKLLDKNKSFLAITPVVICQKKGSKEGFSVAGKYAINIYNASGKVKMKMFDRNNKLVKAGKKASLKKTKKFYVLQLNNFPLHNKTNVDKDIPVNGKYMASLTFSLVGLGKRYSGFFYIDDLALKAKKTTKINYNTKDYTKNFAFETLNQKHYIPVEVAPAPVK